MAHGCRELLSKRRFPTKDNLKSNIEFESTSQECNLRDLCLCWLPL